ncbi:MULTISPECIES: LysR family transcriptional regulator [unclassified Duganella]|uniref:LysR family transcriptional regulator n=1 Tax=unclassified Duganella TaxID=2636909 RepID=UPI0006F9C478|nr:MULTISPECIES: LysR family transcriptional regulator [unclassified Duganella]KQV45853.1 LysR family transcriptional regulator [Duganella sp. Root336D2]KRC03729.1 LysR family transcriptional regulator [Duganella sp. Root198D2]
MSPTVRQMRALVAVARTGSFTAAADLLHVTQSALSGQIKELEQLLGVKVVERNTRRVQLSEVGRELYPLFDKMLQDLDGAMADIASRKALKKGIVRVAAPQMMACTLLPQVIGAFRSSYPDVQVQLVDCPVDNVASRVVSGEVDVGIGPERDLTAEVDAALLFEMPFVVVFPPAHPLAARRTVAWAEVNQHPFIALQGQFTQRLLRDMTTLAPYNEVTFMTTALAMVAEGLGITACLPYAEPMVRRYGLEMRPLVEPELKRKFFIYTKNSRTPSPAAERFISVLGEYSL